MSTIRRIAAIGAGALLLVTAAAASAGAVSEKQYRKQVNALCVELEDDRIPLLPASGGSIYSRKDAAAASAYVTQAVPLYQELIDGVSALKAPKAKAAAAKKLVSALEDSVAGIQADPMSAFSPLDNPFQEAYDASKRLKTKSCDNIAAQRF